MRQVALLRGINVGGRSAVKMTELSQLLTELGLEQVKTYINSGNAVFQSELPQDQVAAAIDLAFATRFGFQVPIHVRSLQEMESLVDQMPYSQKNITQAAGTNLRATPLHAYFLATSPSPTEVDRTCATYMGPDQLRAGNRALYFLTEEGMGQSKLAPRIGKQFPTATARNWRTVTHLVEMLRALS